MANLNFPGSPSTGDVYTLGTRAWIWNGVSWVTTHQLNYVIANTLNVAIISLGNTIANQYSNSIIHIIANATSNVVITPQTLFIGNAIANQFSNSIIGVLANATTNTIITPGSFFTGNSIANVVANSISLTAANATANAILTPVSLFLGNSIANQFSNSITQIVANATANVVVTPLTISIGNSIANVFMNSISQVSANATANSKQFPNYLQISTNGPNAISTPETNTGAYFVRDVAGQKMGAFISPTSYYTLQPHIGRNRNYLWQALPASTAVTGGFGFGPAANTIATIARTPAAGNLFLSVVRMGVGSNTTANIAGELRPTGATVPFWRGNATDQGGFTMIARWGPSIIAAQQSAFVGMSNVVAALPNNATGVTGFTNLIGFGFNRAITNLHIVSANATVANTIDLGASFPVNTGNAHWYETVIYAPPNGGTVSYLVRNLSTGAVAAGDFNQTNLPATTVFMMPKVWITNGSTAALASIDVGTIYVETDS